MHVRNEPLYLTEYWKGRNHMEKFVTCESRGLTLRGMMHIPDQAEGKLPFVILFHGFCDDRNEINFVHTELSRRLCAAGIASVRFDFAGSGESDGLFEDMTVSNEVQDGCAILDWVKSLDFVDQKRIALHGLSLGGCVASIVAGLHHEDVAALSMWCPAPDVVYNLAANKTICGEDYSAIVENGCADYEGLKVGIGFYNDTLTLDPFAIAAQFDKNVNLVHGDVDITASINCSVKYKEIFGDRAQFLTVHGAEHRFKSFAFRKARMESAMNFLTKELLG